MLFRGSKAASAGVVNSSSKTAISHKRPTSNAVSFSALEQEGQQQVLASLLWPPGGASPLLTQGLGLALQLSEAFSNSSLLSIICIFYETSTFPVVFKHLIVSMWNEKLGLLGAIPERIRKGAVSLGREKPLK